MIGPALDAAAATAQALSSTNTDHLQTLIAECTFGILILGGVVTITTKINKVLNTLSDHGKRLKSLERSTNGGKVLPDSPKTV